MATPSHTPMLDLEQPNSNCNYGALNSRVWVSAGVSFPLLFPASRDLVPAPRSRLSSSPQLNPTPSTETCSFSDVSKEPPCCRRRWRRGFWEECDLEIIQQNLSKTEVFRSYYSIQPHPISSPLAFFSFFPTPRFGVHSLLTPSRALPSLLPLSVRNFPCQTLKISLVSLVVMGS
jgi:hypothetical protein